MTSSQREVAFPSRLHPPVIPDRLFPREWLTEPPWRDTQPDILRRAREVIRTMPEKTLKDFTTEALIAELRRRKKESRLLEAVKLPEEEDHAPSD